MSESKPKGSSRTPAPEDTPEGSQRRDRAPRLRSSLPVLGGRMGVGVALLVGIAIVAPQWLNSCVDRTLHPDEPKTAVEWKDGTEANVELTLITADSRRLHCAHDTVLDGVHCGYKADKKAWPRAPGAPVDDNDEDVIQPYRTADTNALILVSGLWAQPEIALRLHREPPTYYDASKQIRFVAYCKVRFVGDLADVALRWDNGAKWLDEPKAKVAKALHCTLEAPTG
jgi:hypothetical protein